MGRAWISFNKLKSSGTLFDECMRSKVRRMAIRRVQTLDNGYLSS